MKFEVSSLSFTGPKINDMAKLPNDFGIEIFYEWGGISYWKKALEIIMQDRDGTFSIHSPFVHTDLSDTEEDEQWLFDYLREPFDLYHKYNGKHYVVHTNSPLKTAPNEKGEEERRKIVADRLDRFQYICNKEGVDMVVENLGFGDGKRTLFNKEQFIKLFTDNKKLKCLYDTGHGTLEKFSYSQIQEALKERLTAYHIHDNNGKSDQHLRIGLGIIDWKLFVEGYQKYTPEAVITMEYNNADVDDYLDDANRLIQLI